MKPEYDTASVLDFSAIWDDLDPGFVDQALTEVMQSFNGDGSSDPMEAIVRSRVLTQIGQTPVVIRVAGKKPFAWRDFLKTWSRSPYVRTAAAAILILSLVGVLLRPFAGPRPEPTTPATTQAATTAATTAVSTKPATTAATTMTPTQAGTTAATTVATTITPTGAMVWPIHLIRFLDFDQSQVESVQIRRLRSDGSFDKVVTLTDKGKIDRVFDLINQIHLEKPASLDLRLEGASYELVFNLVTDTSDTPFLALKSHEGSETVTVHGSFNEILKADAPNGFMQANPYLTFDEISDRLDEIFE